MAQPIADRIKKHSKIDQHTECWVWPFGHMKNGYGRIKIGYEKKLAHRISYEAFVGPIPDGLQIDHLCRNRACVNPNHLEPVTQRENLLRGVGASAKNHKKTHCLRGHEFSGENLLICNGVRYCRTCQKIRAGRRT